MPREHIVKAGECLSSIARLYGFGDYKLIYDHPGNGAFRAKRKNPNLLYPGDKILIPESQSKSAAITTGQRHTFMVHREKVRLRLLLKDRSGQPYASKRFRLQVGAAALEGQTDASGLLDKEIPPDAQEGELTLWFDDPTGPGITISLHIGHLDPHDTLTGVRGRLNNLGFSSEAVEPDLDERTKGALRTFQERYGLRVSGEPDEATMARLRDLHDAQEG